MTSKSSEDASIPYCALQPQSASSPFCAATVELVEAFNSNSIPSQHIRMPEKSIISNPVAPSLERTEPLNFCPLLPNLTVELLSPRSNDALTPPTPGSSLKLSPLESSTNSSIHTSGCPPHGVKAVCGKRSKMEDTYVVQVNFFDLPPSSIEDSPFDKIPPRLSNHGLSSPESEGSVLSSSTQSHCICPIPSDIEVSTKSVSDSATAGSSDTLHFFGVYDGHGGSEAAQHCANRLHQHLNAALVHVTSMIQGDGAHSEPPAEWTQMGSDYSHLAQESTSCNVQTSGVPPCQASSTATATATGTDIDHEAEISSNLAKTNLTCRDPSDHDTKNKAAEGKATSGKPDDACIASTTTWSDSSTSSKSCESMSVSSLLEEALRDAFLKTDAEFATEVTASTVGSTAVVALLGKKRMWVANCGDSRAVLCRGGKALQLTDDHKPEREDEAERVEKAGGQITVLLRTRDDDFILLASDGLWDVMTNQEAAQLAIRCMSRAREKGASRKAAVRVAASVLTSAAIDRGSKDNVTVVIVDLKATKEACATPVPVPSVIAAAPTEPPLAGAALAVPAP
eukprot:gene17380-23682_t